MIHNSEKMLERTQVNILILSVDSKKNISHKHKRAHRRHPTVINIQDLS